MTRTILHATRRLLRGRPRPSVMWCVLMAGAWLIVTPAARGSIQVPDAFDMDALSIVAICAGGAGNSNAAPDNQKSVDENEQQHLHRIAVTDAFPGGNSSSSSSSSSGGSSGGSPTAVDCVGAMLIAEPAASPEWVAGQFCLTLPMPPGTDLLRPPQAV